MNIKKNQVERKAEISLEPAWCLIVFQLTWPKRPWSAFCGLQPFPVAIVVAAVGTGSNIFAIAIWV